MSASARVDRVMGCDSVENTALYRQRDGKIERDGDGEMVLICGCYRSGTGTRIGEDRTGHGTGTRHWVPGVGYEYE